MLPPESESAPFLGSWKRIYWSVIVYLAVVIGALAVFAASFRI
jgi:hypothetical protein